MSNIKSYIDLIVNEYWGQNVKKFMFAAPDDENNEEDIRDYDPKNPYDAHSKINNVSKTHPSAHIKKMNMSNWGSKTTGSSKGQFPGGRNQSV